MIVALTGATGFVGAATLDALLARGHQIRALTRRDQPARNGVAWIRGKLEKEDDLARLASGADAVLHVAGVVSGSRAEFIRGNVEGTHHMMAAARSMGIRRFVYVSSLAAREPQLSDYGRSKERSEAEVMGSDRDWTVVRPPGVYGPGDLAMRDVFRMAQLGVVLLPPAGRVSLIHVRDLAALLVALIEHDPGRHVYECDDGSDGGYAHEAFARLIGEAVGRKPVALNVPAFVLKTAARVDMLLRGGNAKLTLDRASYLSHVDWVARASHRPPDNLWTPDIPIETGLRETAAWYHAQGLL